MLSEENLGNIVGKIVSSTTSTILKYLMGIVLMLRKGPWVSISVNGFQVTM